MTGRSIVWAAIGLVVGVGQVTALWRTAHRNRTLEWSYAARLPLVAAALIVAAYMGSLLPATVGWAVGLISTGTFLLGSGR